MASGATMHHVEVALSDVDRGVYESLDLRVAQHPSESMRYMLTRTLAYCLSYEEGIAFSKGGLSDTDEAPIAVKDPTGVLLAWIDIGAPSAERLHKASKAARKVTIFTHAELAQLRKEASTKAIHKLDAIEVYRFPPAFLDAIIAKMERNTSLEVTRNDGQLYVAIDGSTFETPLPPESLLATP
ncbi:MAG: hypothetical protein JWP97_3395 [Labilithrix sp.]|nr:hypothetical protein [Labilithrix sp.]